MLRFISFSLFLTSVLVALPMPADKFLSECGYQKKGDLNLCAFKALTKVPAVKCDFMANKKVGRDEPIEVLRFELTGMKNISVAKVETNYVPTEGSKFAYVNYRFEDKVTPRAQIPVTCTNQNEKMECRGEGLSLSIALAKMKTALRTNVLALEGAEITYEKANFTEFHAPLCRLDQPISPTYMPFGGGKTEFKTVEVNEISSEHFEGADLRELYNYYSTTNEFRKFQNASVSQRIQPYVEKWKKGDKKGISVRFLGGQIHSDNITCHGNFLRSRADGVGSGRGPVSDWLQNGKKAVNRPIVGVCVARFQVGSPAELDFWSEEPFQPEVSYPIVVGFDEATEKQSVRLIPEPLGPSLAVAPERFPVAVIYDNKKLLMSFSRMSDAKAPEIVAE